MKNIKYFILLFSILFFARCIENDLPYPIVNGEILSFEAKGEIKKALIDTDKRIVTISLSETVDISKVEIIDFKMNEEAKSTSLDISKPIDLRKPYEFLIKTYQDYIWTIVGIQEIERFVVVENQIGKSVIDAENKKVSISVSKQQALDDIKIIEFKLGLPSAKVSPDPFTTKDFSNPRIFKITQNEQSEDWIIEIVQSDFYLSTSEVNAWAKFAYVEGDYYVGMQKPVFEYKKSGENEWISIPESEISYDDNLFKTKIKNLSPDTEYLVRTVSGETIGNELEFVTEKELTIPNLNFDDWRQHKRGIRKDWFPNIDSTEVNWWWDSGNRGANMLGDVNPTAPEEELVVSGKAARLKSQFVGLGFLGKFAAGSIYTGKFVELVGMSGAKLDMGKAFTNRPTALKGNYRYTSGTIDYADAPYTELKGKSDSCHIYIVLSDRTEPYHINTVEKQFIDFDGEDVIAFAQLIDGEGTDGQYKEFELELKYRDLKRKPKSIVIVASSSKYGDYFTGSTQSLLYIDEFELLY